MTENAKAGATGPLTGVRIVDMTSVVLGAYATQIMGDMGADVIKIEAPTPTGGGGRGGDIMRWAGAVPEGASPDLGPIYLTINRNKRSVKLELKGEKGRGALETLIHGADVFASNVRYDGLKRLKLGYEDVKALKNDIVFVHAAGYGSDGPYAGLPAYDDLIQAGSGAADLIPRMDGNPKPRYIPSLIADKSTGLMMANAILAALFHKERTGEGQFVEVPMLETITSFVLAEHFYGHVYEPPTGHWGYNRVMSPDRRPYETANGHIGLMPYSDKQWNDFFAASGRPDALSGDPRFSDYSTRTQHIAELYEMIEEVTRTKTTEEWLDILKPLNIPVVKMNRLDDLQSDPHLQAVGFFEKREHPHAGPYWSMKPPVKFSATPTSVRLDPPRLGADTEEVLADFGMEADDIAAVIAECDPKKAAE